MARKRTTATDPKRRVSWANMGGEQGKPAKRRLPPAVSPRVGAPSSIFDCVHIIPPPYGSAKEECRARDHVWSETGSRPDFVVLNCVTCGAGGDICGPDAKQQWAQLEEAMRKRDKVA